MSRTQRMAQVYFAKFPFEGFFNSIDPGPPTLPTRQVASRLSKPAAAMRGAGDCPDPERSLVKPVFRRTKRPIPWATESRSIASNLSQSCPDIRHSNFQTEPRAFVP